MSFDWKVSIFFTSFINNIYLAYGGMLFVTAYSHDGNPLRLALNMILIILSNHPPCMKEDEMVSTTWAVLLTKTGLT